MGSEGVKSRFAGLSLGQGGELLGNPSFEVARGMRKWYCKVFG